MYIFNMLQPFKPYRKESEILGKHIEDTIESYMLVFEKTGRRLEKAASVRVFAVRALGRA
jgi:hypothetical protein